MPHFSGSISEYGGILFGRQADTPPPYSFIGTFHHHKFLLQPAFCLSVLPPRSVVLNVHTCPNKPLLFVSTIMDPPGFGRALKRMADEDIEDLRLVSEASEHLNQARKRLKSRQDVRDEFLFNDMPLNDVLSAANAAGDGFGAHLDPFDSASRVSSIELGRDLSGDNRFDPSFHVQGMYLIGNFSYLLSHYSRSLQESGRPAGRVP